MVSSTIPLDSFRSLIYFVAVAEVNSFTKAAEDLGISKSAVGKSISRLEQHLGVQLFHRSTRKMSLTTEGEQYLKSCLDALHTLESAQNTLRANLKDPSGIVRIDMPSAFGRKVMVPILMEMSDEYPQLNFIITFNDKVIDPQDFGFDLAIRFGEVKDSLDIVAKYLNDQQLVLCASTEYLEKNGIPETMDDLHQHQCLVAWRGAKPLGWLLKNETLDDVRFYPKPFHQISDGDAMVEACLLGAGIMQFPYSLVKEHIANKKLQLILTALNPEPTRLSLIWPRTSVLLPGLRHVINRLMDLSDQHAFK
ncbi:LysR family transcriptional regulator [Acinetobacter puyangensis]|uniref:DNA-binding transcriptional regulator, LysR family n=1 Tax=Acinetobacter puyangensis TaxID=1096779 RepID=A0A240EDU4_9GAMM|nr:LysR family transcriptional regulator [Acinetobacter puyangensis]SNX46864.1 DNA-binding transcriptional regulator, LysR family [Acinetobacter puyangensis]